MKMKNVELMCFMVEPNVVVLISLPLPLPSYDVLSGEHMFRWIPRQILSIDQMYAELVELVFVVDKIHYISSLALSVA